jgi:hypothetical protein
MSACSGCGRLQLECVADPVNRRAAVAFATARRGPTSVPFAVLVDDGTCMVGLLNALAALVGEMADQMDGGADEALHRAGLAVCRQGDYEGLT